MSKVARKLLVSLREGLHRPSSPSRVDRDKGIIYDVKILGPESVNKRRYTSKAIHEAVRARLYEGAPCNVDHPDKPTDSRKAMDRFGKFVNVIEKADGVYADLHYLKSHPMAERVCEAAERMPDILGFSHNANGEGKHDNDGTLVVETITEVTSVDLVADPATTHGLFESQKPMKTIKLTDALKAIKAAKLPRGTATKLKRLLEAEDGENKDDEKEKVEEGEDEDDKDKKPDFRAAMEKICENEDLDSDGKIAAIKELMSEADDDEEEEKVEEDGSSEIRGKNQGAQKRAMWAKDPDNPYADDINRKLKALQRKDEIRDLCEDAGIKPSKDFLKTLLEVSSPKAVKLMIEQQKKLETPGTDKRRSGPRSQAPGTTKHTTTEAKIPDKAEDWAKSLLE